MLWRLRSQRVIIIIIIIIKIWTVLSSILSGITRVTDRQTDRRTDGRTDRILLAIPRLHYMQRSKNTVDIKANYTLSQKTSPMLLAITRDSIVGVS